jgi:phage gp46-like protein
MKLMVSHDAGSRYWEAAQAETTEPLLARAEELRLDEQGLRWVIESDDGRDIVEASAIHKAILAFMAKVRPAEAGGEA